MPDITTQIKTAIGDEPPLGFGPTDVIAAARGVRRRRRGVYAGVTAGVAAAVAAGTVLALPAGGGGGGGGGGGTRAPGPADGHATGLSLTALSRIAGKPPAGPRGLPAGQVDGVTAAEAFALFTKDTGMQVTAAQASLLRGDLDLAAGVAVGGHPYLNIQVTGANTMITAMPTCAELSDLASGSGDGYYGPCSVRRLADGSILIVRSGETKQGHYTMAQATLIKRDGSGVFVEDTNQTVTTASDQVAAKKRAAAGAPPLPSVVRVNPPVGASALAAFVRDVAARS
jgi:hypothetical protein